MSKVNHSEFTRLLLLACSLFLLAACSDSDDPPLPADVIDDGTDGGSDDGSGGGSGDDTGDAGGAPEGVLVVSGDSDSSEVQNTISWALGEDGSEYTVYWDNAAGVTDASSVVVPAAEGFRYVVHAGAEVLAGSEYYYRVQAITNDTASALSVAANLGIPIVDGDPVGRAVPELQQSTFFINRVSIAPMALATKSGDVIIIENVTDSFKAERIVRSIAVANDGCVGVTDHPQDGAGLKRSIIAGTLSNAEKIGSALEQTHDCREVARAGGGFVLFRGEIQQRSD